MLSTIDEREISSPGKAEHVIPSHKRVCSAISASCNHVTSREAGLEMIYPWTEMHNYNERIVIVSDLRVPALNEDINTMTHLEKSYTANARITTTSPYHILWNVCVCGTS